ncbi:HAD-IB family hydrolase [Oleisolibacter albus]|uniref:HAD-IB family hydrolase n=1 Tax=Oleisolibacter albus TaxID=2171757 RepID=UPI000DF1A449|nr:HAD-IB family hydrolase [Oleisolibacter albus]
MTGLAIFDFDGTLVAGDSLIPFVERVVGRRRTRLAFALAIRHAMVRAARARSGFDLRTAIKADFLARTLADLPVEQVTAAAEGLAGWLRWHGPTLNALRRHAEKGDRVVVATGALALYMPTLLRGLPVDDLLATRLEQRDGILTGAMEGGNCVRDEKARRIAAYMAVHGPFSGSWGYGNRPSDLPFLALMQHPTVVPTVRR